jgi:uncharacterized membrane protein YfcA
LILATGIIFLIAVVAGLIGAILGLGGGIIITPALTLLLGINIKYAIGASIISVIATSSGAAIAYIRDRLTNLRVGMFLEIATTIGAVTGAFITGMIHPDYLYIIFGAILLYSALAMIRKGRQEIPKVSNPDPLADRLKLHGEYFDNVLHQKVTYKVTGVYGGFGMMVVAGIISGLLGIGSGIFKVMAMDLFMKLPLKVSSATSNFMIGVTAAASAGIYFVRGNIDPQIAAPVALGVLIGAAVGTKVMKNLKSSTIRKLFVPVLAIVAIQMLMKGLNIKL